jgi:PTS system fructose-specific IIC component
MAFSAESLVPHGGIIVLFIPGAIKNPGAWVVALVAGTLVSTAALWVTTRSYARAKAGEPPRGAVPAAAPA